jgi:hypothetical protein
VRRTATRATVRAAARAALRRARAAAPAKELVDHRPRTKELLAVPQKARAVALQARGDTVHVQL